MQSDRAVKYWIPACEQMLCLILRSWQAQCGTAMSQGGPPAVLVVFCCVCISEFARVTVNESQFPCLGKNGPVLLLLCAWWTALVYTGPTFPHLCSWTVVSSGFRDIVLRALFTTEGSWRSVVLWWSHSHPSYLLWHTWQRKLRWTVHLQPQCSRWTVLQAPAWTPSACLLTEESIWDGHEWSHY